MPDLFFAGDHHLDHKKIVHEFKHRRPFSSIEEHNEELIKRHNERVRPQDTVWFLGDVILASSNYELIRRFNGKKKLIIGNHDTAHKIKHYYEYFDRIVAYDTIGKSIILSHIPVHHSQLESRYKINIHGHTHGFSLDDPRYFNVSMEVIDYTPIKFQEIQTELRNRGLKL